MSIISDSDYAQSIKRSEQFDTQDWVPSITDYDLTSRQRILVNQLLCEQCVITVNGSIGHQLANELWDLGLVETREFPNGLVYIVLTDDAELLDTVELTGVELEALPIPTAA